MMKTPTLLTALLLFGVTATLAAEDLVSGPPVGTKLSTVECYANSGPFSGQEAFDAAKVIGDNPGAFLFIHVLNRNTAPVLRGFDNLTTELGLFGFEAFLVMLGSDRTAGEEQMARVNGSLRLRHPIVLSLDGLDGPGDLALNRRCTLSLVVVNEGKVTQTFGFTDTGLYDLERIRASFESAIGEIPTDPAKLLAMAKANLPKDDAALRELAARQSVDLYRANKQASLDQQNSRRYPNRENMRGNSRQREMQRERRPNPREQAVEGSKSEKKNEKSDSTRVRRGGPPSDSELNGLLRSFIRRTNSGEMVDDVFASIEKRAKESAELDQEAIAMFQLMLSYPDRYGSEHAQKLAKQFLTERGEE